jgi:hypothetical protein
MYLFCSGRSHFVENILAKSPLFVHRCEKTDIKTAAVKAAVDRFPGICQGAAWQNGVPPLPAA